MRGAERGPCDLVVMGAGLAGSVSALRAAELGLRVVLVDAADDPTAGGNTALSGGSLHVATVPMTAPASELRRRTGVVTGDLASPELADAFAQNSGRALAWLLWNGIRAEKPTPAVSWKTVLAPIRRQDDANGWPDKGPQVALRRLHLALRRRRGTVLTGTRITELKMAGHRVTGVKTIEGASIAASAVVLADGGFQSNAELRKRFIGPAADQLFIRGSKSGQGDALLMGIDAGAQTVNMRSFYGRCLHREAITNDRLWPMPFLDDLLMYGVLVDRGGRRIVDEARGGIWAANALARSPDPAGAAIVLDRSGWEAAYGRSGYSGSGGSGQPPANPEIEIRGGTIHRAEDLSALAAKARIDPRGLEQTVTDTRRRSPPDRIIFPRGRDPPEDGRSSVRGWHCPWSHRSRSRWAAS